MLQYLDDYNADNDHRVNLETVYKTLIMNSQEWAVKTNSFTTSEQNT